MCRERYKDYESLITTGRWKKIYSKYKNALSSNKVSSSIGVLRGNRKLELPHRRDVFTLLVQTKGSSSIPLARNLGSDCNLNLSLKQLTYHSSIIRFNQHPAERAFIEAINNSDQTIIRQQVLF